LRKPASPFRYFNSSPKVIRLVVLMYVRFPPSLCDVEDLLVERGIDICHETVRMWWNRFGPMFARWHPPPAGEPDAGLSPLALASR
jgi:putative transposase